MATINELVNPFEFEAANKFTIQEMVDYFISDDTYTRFVRSRKNVFLLGDRGTGKTMALRYYSAPVQEHLRQSGRIDREAALRIVGVYVPCRTPGLTKSEPELLNSFLGRLNGEHLLVALIICCVAESLEAVPDLISDDEARLLRDELQYVLPWRLQASGTVMSALARAAKHEWRQAQRELNRRTRDGQYENIVTFSSALLPLIEVLVSSITQLQDSHFSLMFDDAEVLSTFQNESLNSWIATRDTSRLSFKVATNAVDKRPLTTVGGGGLLERHDFIRVDLEQDFQSSEAAYGQLAQKIIERRLASAGIGANADGFFPANTTFVAGLVQAGAKARAMAAELGLEGRQVRDYVHRMQRAIYFRDRSPNANRPPYSGFELLVHVSTGVVRYLLEPCYEMFDRAVSTQGDKTRAPVAIPPAIQTDCLHDMSKRRWEWVRDAFNSSVEECTREDASHIHSLIDQLGVLFRYRLMNHQSEPRAISFSVSAWDGISKQKRDQLERLFRLARRAQILFERLSTGKRDGRQDRYYTFDRLFWIERGLDPVGQNARVSIEARFLWSAAFENQALPTTAEGKREVNREGSEQLKLDGGHE